MLTLQFYTRKACSLCDSAFAVVKRVQQREPFQLECIDIEDHADLVERYGSVIPVVSCGKVELARSFVDEKSLISAIKNLPAKG